MGEHAGQRPAVRALSPSAPPFTSPAILATPAQEHQQVSVNSYALRFSGFV